MAVDGLRGSSAKERKALRSAWRLQRPAQEPAGAMGPSAWTPPPPICNRVANCTWDSAGSGCKCDQWPQWLHRYGVPSGRAKPVDDFFDGNVEFDPGSAQLPVARGSGVSYFRPKGSKGFFFYSGVLGGVWSVQFPSGVCRIVAEIN